MMPSSATTERPVLPLPRRVRLPAWAVSLTVHLAAAVALALFVSPPVRTPSEEPPRDVGIVLAPRDARQHVSYFRESSAPPETSLAAAETAGGEGGRAGGSSASLPRNVDPSDLLLPHIQLPGTNAAVGSPDQLAITSIKLGGGRPRGPILPGGGEEAILAAEAARKAKQRALGPTTQVSLFGSAEAVGRSFVFAIDRSGSMGGEGLNALAAARAELARGIAHLEPTHKFQILAYNHQAHYFNTTRLIPASDEHKALVPKFIDSLSGYGGTLHEMAVRAALAMEPDVVFLLTDGGDPPLNDIQLANLRKLAEHRSRIHTIQFGAGPRKEEDNFLVKLAQQNRGAYTYVDMRAR